CSSANLIRFVTLTREQNNVVPLSEIDRALYRSEAVGNALMLRRAHACLDVIDDRVRVLGAGIIAGNDNAISSALRDLTHQRPLTLVAISASAKDHDQFSTGEGPSRLQASLECVGSVRVIPDDGRARRNDLESAGYLWNGA